MQYRPIDPSRLPESAMRAHMASGLVGLPQAPLAPDVLTPLLPKPNVRVITDVRDHEIDRGLI